MTDSGLAGRPESYHRPQRRDSRLQVGPHRSALERLGARRAGRRAAGRHLHSDPMAGRLLIYGANGYTGRLVAAQAVAAGLAPIAAGRDATAVAAVARELGLEHRVFGLDSPGQIDAGLD